MGILVQPIDSKGSLRQTMTRAKAPIIMIGRQNVPLRTLLKIRSLCLLFLLAVAIAHAQSPFAPRVSGPLSAPVVAYQIDAKYDPAQHAVDATETLTYHNLTGQPLDHFPFHLYLNAFQPDSTWVSEAHREGNFRSSAFGGAWDPKHSGSNTVTSLEIIGIGDLTKRIKLIAPDDGNLKDKTVFDV